MKQPLLCRLALALCLMAPSVAGSTDASVLEQDALEQDVAALLDQAVDPESRPAARARLLALGREATPLLIPRMLAGPMEARFTAVSLQAEILDPRALEALAEVAARDVFPLLRLEALRVLGRYQDPSPAFARLRLVLAADTEEAAARWNAAFALAMFGQDDGLALLHAGARAPDPMVRWQALEALRRVHDEDTVRVLAPLLVSPEEGDRQELVLTLGRIGGPEAFLMLVGALGDTSPEVRWRASMALGTLGNVRAILPLRRLLTRELDPQVIRHAEEALSRLEALL